MHHARIQITIKVESTIIESDFGSTTAIFLIFFASKLIVWLGSIFINIYQIDSLFNYNRCLIVINFINTIINFVL